ncbi:MAG: YceI family protein [Mariniphaga sp.]
MSKKLSILGRMKLALVVMTVIFTVFSIKAKAADYVVDKGVSAVKWEAKKVTGQHNGTISFANGSIAANNAVITGGTLVIDMKSIVDVDLTDAGYNKKLIGHLSSEDFFAVDKFPEATLVVKKATAVSGDDYKISGDLTIKGVTNPIEFNAKVKQSGDKLSADGIMTVNRAKFGVKYGSSSFFQGLGDKVIYDDFTLAFSIVASKK